MPHAGKLLALAALFAASPLAAQSGGTIELGAFGRYTSFGEKLADQTLKKLPADNGFGGGLRLGVFLARNFALEVDGSYLEVDAAGGGRLNHIPIRAGFTYNFPLGGKSAFLLGARYVHNLYGEDADESDHGYGAVAGFRFGPLRVEGLFDWMPHKDVMADRYHNFGVHAGLSLLLGGCNKSADGVTVTPSSVTVDRGERTTFTAVATRCGKSTPVTWTATGGSITENGEYTAGQESGTFAVTATEPRGGLTSTATVVIRTPPPPPPPPPPAATMSRVDLKPDQAKLKLNETVTFTVDGIMSDGRTQTLTNCTLTATGNPTQSGLQFSWSRHGSYTVTAQCGTLSDVSNIDVPLEVVLYGTNFRFNRSDLTPSGIDSVRAAADSLKKYPDINVRLSGFADFVGTDAYNCGLSWRRVRTVERTLLSMGITANRFTAVEGFGEAYPVPDDQVPQEWRDINTRTRDRGKWWDRRVDITSMPKPAGMASCAEPPRR